MSRHSSFVSVGLKLWCLLMLHAEALSGPPFSLVDPVNLHPTVLRSGSTKPGKMFGSFGKAKPTNAWWENIVLTAEPGGMDGVVFQMPYFAIAGRNALQVSVPKPTKVSAMQFFDPNLALTLGVVGELPMPTVASWDELSVTVDWKHMNTPLVRGAAYITVEYSGLAPNMSTLQSLNGTSIYVDGVRAACDGASVLTGSLFAFDFMDPALNTSTGTWMLFAPTDSEWICQRSPFSMIAQAKLHGAVRFAFAGFGNHGFAALLQKHAGRYPVSSAVELEVEGDVGTVSHEWKTGSLKGWANDVPLLQLAWPVHLPLFSAGVRQAAAANPSTPFKDLRGKATAVVGDSWHLHYDLFPDVGFAAPRPVEPGMKKMILDVLKVSGSSSKWNGDLPDNQFDLPPNVQIGVADTYFSGKMLARMARLLAIADELGESKEDYFKEMLGRLTKYLAVWLGRGAKDPLLYDATWGGIVACGCVVKNGACNNNVTPAEACPAINDVNTNFGNGFYNDHHYHYGYFVYAAAVAAKHDPTWELEWREQILALIRDYANPSSADASFPITRHKDWFMGFSWAGGITPPNPNGRNQESTSEAINAYYAIYVYAAAVDAPFAKQMKDLGRVLTAMEVHGADTYWHVRNKSDIYTTDFPFLYPTAAMVWSNLVNHVTYFGAQTYFVEGIHLMPITPIMETFLKEDWMVTQFPAYKKSCDAKCETAGFSWQVCMEQAMVNTTEALACLQSLPEDAFSASNAGSNGNSMTNSLHWIATRGPSFSLPGPAPAPTPGATSEMRHCNFGDTVQCPGEAFCNGNQCCMDGSTCPSASQDFSDCAEGKTEDCTKSDYSSILIM